METTIARLVQYLTPMLKEFLKHILQVILGWILQELVARLKMFVEQIADRYRMDREQAARERLHATEMGDQKAATEAGEREEHASRTIKVIGEICAAVTSITERLIDDVPKLVDESLQDARKMLGNQAKTRPSALLPDDTAQSASAKRRWHWRRKPLDPSAAPA